MPLTIRSQRVLLREHDRLVIKPARIHVRGALITRVEVLPSNDVDVVVPPDGRASDAPPSATPQEEHDLGDRLITPAFVNAHTHLALAFLRGVETARVRRNLVEDLYFAYESRLSPDDIRAFTRMGAYESLLSGVGFVWDHYYGGSAVADALRDTGLTGVVSPTLQDLAGPDRDGAEAALDATLQIADDARYREASVYVALGPHATDTVSPGLFRRIAEIAEQRGLPVHLHVAQSYDELARVEAREGRSPLALLAREGILSRAPRVLMAHGLFASTPDLRALDPSRHTLVFCPSSQLQFGFPAPVSRWSELGVPWVVATDCASSNDSMNVQKELRLCQGAASAEITGSLEYASFMIAGEVGHARDTWHERTERAKAFGRHVTSDRLLARVFHEAGALHPDVDAGVIADGALANLAVWNTDHPGFWPGHDLLRALAMSDISQALHALYIAGRAVGEPGHLVESVVRSDAYREARREADGRLAALMR